MRRLGMVLLAILFLFMVFAGPATQKADAVVVSTVVIGAVIAAMAAAGIGLTVSGMTSAQLSDWVSGKLTDWATDIGGSVQDHIDNNLITVTGSGILSIGTAAAGGISDFINWLTIQDNITDNTTAIAVSSQYQLNGKTIVKLPTVTMRNSSGDRYSWSPMNESQNLYAYFKIGSGPCIFNMDNIDTCNAYYNGYRSNWILNGTSGGYTYSTSFWPVDTWENYYPGTSYSGYPLDVFGTPGAITETGSLTYDPTVINVPTINQNDKWFLDVGAAPGTTVDTVTDGVIADTIDGSLTVSGEVAEEEPEFEVTGPIGVSGLTEVFPFCIPFDVYALLSCLSAEPQTPVFTVRFVIPGVINQEFTIDLSPFSTIAQIVRTMELIAFAVGLALVTRERFLRS